MFNITQIKYSMLHSKAVTLLCEKYGFDDYLLEQVKYHDMDKVLHYLAYSVQNSHKNHVSNSKHHLESSLKKEENYLYETIIDWESARYTKSDKPLNAYQTLKKYYPQYIDSLIPLLKKIGIDKDYVEMDKEILREIKNTTITNKKILDDIIKYINHLSLSNESLYFNLKELVLKIYQSLNKEEQLYLKRHLSDKYSNYIDANVKKVRIGIFTHKSCDYDGICSVLSLTEYIKSMTNPDTIEIIPIVEQNDLIKNLNYDQKLYSIEEINSTLDYAIICDVNEQDRIYGLDLINNVDIDKRYIIDHHDKNRVELEALNENKLILPKYSSTCEIVAELLIYNKYDTSTIAELLFCGIASDTFGFERSMSQNTDRIIELLPLEQCKKNQLLYNITKMTPEQEELYKKIKILDSNEDIKIFTLLESLESGDVTKHLKHKKIDKLTGLTE